MPASRADQSRPEQKQGRSDQIGSEQSRPNQSRAATACLLACTAGLRHSSTALLLSARPIAAEGSSFFLFRSLLCPLLPCPAAPPPHCQIGCQRCSKLEAVLGGKPAPASICICVRIAAASRLRGSPKPKALLLPPQCRSSSSFSLALSGSSCLCSSAHHAFPLGVHATRALNKPHPYSTLTLLFPTLILTIIYDFPKVPSPVFQSCPIKLKSSRPVPHL